MELIEIGSPEWAGLVEHCKQAASRGAWDVADDALQAAPEGCPDVAGRLRRFAEDTELAFGTIQERRLTAIRWPKPSRLDRVSFEVHSVIRDHPDREELIKQATSVTHARQLLGRSTESRSPEERKEQQLQRRLLDVVGEMANAEQSLRSAARIVGGEDFTEEQRELLSERLGEVQTRVNQLSDVIAGMSLDQALATILGPGD